MRAGIVGCGKIFPMHAVSITEQPNVTLVSVCDIKEERAQKAAKQFGCTYYVDYKDMIEQEKLDTIHICTPHYLHAEMAIYGLKHGLDILTEKPMAIKLEDAREMIATAHAEHRNLVVSFQNRFNPGSILIKKTLESGELGKVLGASMFVTWDRSDQYYLSSDWKGTWEKEGGGVIIDQAIHTIDLMNWFINSKPVSVEASLHNRTHSIIDVEDSAEGVITYENGIHAGFYAINYYTWDAPIRIEIHCEKGLIHLVGEKAVIQFKDGHEYVADKDPQETFHFGEVKQYWGVGHKREIANFYSCLQDKKTPSNTAKEVWDTQRIVCAIYESSKLCKKIIL